MQNHIVYLAYGRDHVNECRYSLLKYLSLYNLQASAQHAVTVYTDAPAQFDSFLPFFPHFKLETVGAEQLRTWQGERNNPYRVKAFIIHRFLQGCDGNFLFCDTDTFPLQRLESFFANVQAGAVYMHAAEGVLNPQTNPLAKKWHTVLKDQVARIDNRTLRFPETTQLWNAGIIALPCPAAAQLNDVVVLTDFFYERRQTGTTGQMAIGYLLQQQNTIRDGRNYFYHYRDLKEFRRLLQTFFQKNEEESVPNLVKALHHLDVAGIQEQKQKFQRLPVLKKWAQRLTGKGWSIRPYAKKIGG